MRGIAATGTDVDRLQRVWVTLFEYVERVWIGAISPGELGGLYLVKWSEGRLSDRPSDYIPDDDGTKTTVMRQ
jgi:hypothetical protein